MKTDLKNMTICCLTLVLIGTFALYIFSIKPYYNDLKQELKEQEDIILVSKSKIEAVMNQNQDLNKQIDTLYSNIRKNNELIDKHKKEIARQYDKFKKLPETIRDSMLNDYIRKNQRTGEDNGR